MRLKSLLLVLASAVMVFALSACGSSGNSGDSGGSGSKGGQDQGKKTQSKSAQSENTKKKDTTAEQAQAPQDKTLKVSIPAMQHVNNATIPNVPYTQQAIDSGVAEQGLKNHAAIHVAGTGYPWQKEANVYLAGHALGYRNTPSWHAFRDLNQLQKGDKIYVQDANGKKYTYEVSKEGFAVDPSEVGVVQPKAGRNILSLQSCTLPDYTRRLVVQAKLVKS